MVDTKTFGAAVALVIDNPGRLTDLQATSLLDVCDALLTSRRRGRSAAALREIQHHLDALTPGDQARLREQLRDTDERYQPVREEVTG